MLSGTGRMVKVAAPVGEKVLVTWLRSLSRGRSSVRWGRGTMGERRVCKIMQSLMMGVSTREEVLGRWVSVSECAFWSPWTDGLAGLEFLFVSDFFNPLRTLKALLHYYQFPEYRNSFTFWTFEAFVYSFSSFFLEACRIFCFPQESETSEQYSWVGLFSSTLWLFTSFWSSVLGNWLERSLLLCFLCSFVWNHYYLDVGPSLRIILFSSSPFLPHFPSFWFSCSVYRMMFSTLFL